MDTSTYFPRMEPSHSLWRALSWRDGIAVVLFSYISSVAVWQPLIHSSARGNAGRAYRPRGRRYVLSLPHTLAESPCGFCSWSHLRLGGVFPEQSPTSNLGT